MAFEAPFHLQRRNLPCKRHLVYAAMASRAAHSFVNVDAVIEINEIRQVMDSRPFDRLARPEAFSHGRKVRAVRPKLRMAVHAGLGRGNTGKGGCLDSRMAIATIYSAIADVMLMAELHRLFARNEGESVIAGAGELSHKP